MSIFIRFDTFLSISRPYPQVIANKTIIVKCWKTLAENSYRIKYIYVLAANNVVRWRYIHWCTTVQGPWTLLFVGYVFIPVNIAVRHFGAYTKPSV